MKKFFTLALAVLMVAALAVTASADNAGLSYSAPYGTVTVDGVIDAAWDNAAWANIENGREAGTPGKFKVMHDDTYIYFLGQFDDITGIDESKLSENFRVGLHLDNCGVTVGSECTGGAYESYIMNRILDGQVWAVYGDTGIVVGEEMDINYTVVTEGNVHTWEARFKATDAIIAGVAGLEVRLDDYYADGGWIGDKAWNTYEKGADEPGMLYLLAADEGNTPADSTPAEDNTPADTAKPAETPKDTGKAPATADAGLAIAAVVMAAGAMVVLKKKR